MLVGVTLPTAIYDKAAHITDTAAGGNSALIGVNLETGDSRRVLEANATMRPEDSPMVVDGNVVSMGGDDLSWSDGFGFGLDNQIYVTVNQLQRVAALNQGMDDSVPPYSLLCFPAIVFQPLGLEWWIGSGFEAL